MGNKNMWLGAYVLFTFFVGIILPIVMTFLMRDWIWLIISGLELLLLVAGVCKEDKVRQHWGSKG